MKRLFLLLTLLLALVGVPAVIYAQDTNPASLAQYFPAETQFYASIRTDDAFLDTLDTLIIGLRDKLPAALNVPKIGLRDAINQALSQDGLTLADLRMWLGDSAAIGFLNLTEAARANGGLNSNNPGYVAVQLNDKAAAIEFFNGLPNFTDNAVSTEEGGFTVYRPADENQRDGGFLALNDEVMLLGIGTAEVPSGGLDGSEKFTAAVGKLPADSYNALIYVDFADLVAFDLEHHPEQMEALEAAGLDVTTLRPLVVGFTILDETSLTIDLIQPALPAIFPALGSIDSTFAANIPDNFSFVIHSGDLTTIVNAALDAIEKASQETKTPMNRDQLAGFFQVATGLNLDDDLLSWTTGDFALLADVDMATMLDQLAIDISMTPDFDPRLGFVMDASADPAKAQAFVETLSGVIMRQMEQSQNSDVTVSMGEVAGVNALIIEGVEASEFGTIDFVMGANDNVFLFADRTTAEAIFSGDFSSLADSAVYQSASAHVLPGSFGVMYADGTGIGDIIALGGTVFAAFRSGQESEMAELIEMLKFGYELFDSATISAAPVEGGDMLVRAVLTLK